MTFNEWLKKQNERDDPIGDLARDAGLDPDWPDDDTSKAEFENYIEARASMWTDTFRAAWREYVESRHSATG